MAKRKKLPPGKAKKVTASVVKAAPLNSLSFLDGFLMAQKVLGKSREEALAAWHEQFKDGFEGLLEEYAALKVDFSEDIFYSEEFVSSMPEVESWWSGVAWVMTRDEQYELSLEAQVGTDLGNMGLGFVSVFDGALYFGPLGLKPDTDPRLRALLPRFREDYLRFIGEMRRLGLQRRLDYLGEILAVLEAIAQGKRSPT